MYAADEQVIHMVDYQCGAFSTYKAYVAPYTINEDNSECPTYIQILETLNSLECL